MKRLDDMDFNEVSLLYKKLFSPLIDITSFDKIKNHFNNIYDKYLEYFNNGYRSKSTLGRGSLQWGRNIIWGWFIETLLKEILLKNKNVKAVDFIGGDSKHQFIYIDETKTITIQGQKTVEPDFIITLKNDKTFYIELKTAAKEIFTIKKGNVEQLYKSSAYNDKITVILMIDLVNNFYSIKNLKYFNNLRPFVNQRMEGQLCYQFPNPDIPITEIINENLEQYLDETIFLLDIIKKLKALKFAEIKNDKKLIKIIKYKMTLEKKEEDKKIKIEDFDIEINKIIEKCPEIITISWNEIFNILGIK